jgi:hypothetical protein
VHSHLGQPGAEPFHPSDDWRQRQREHIEQGLAGVEARLATDLKAELDVLRDSAAELLGLDLAVPEPGGRLAERRRFFYTTAEEAGQTELLAGAVRRRLPGGLGRRAAREHLRGEAPGLVERQIGDGTERMQAALRAAAELLEASDADAARRQTELTGREAALRHVLTTLGKA